MSLDEVYTVRRVGAQDLAVLSLFRCRMFGEFWDGPVDAAAMNVRDEAFFGPLLAGGDAAAWLGETKAGEAVASAIVVVYTLPPKPWAVDGRTAYVCSMFTDPAHRRRGLARRLFGECLEFSRALGVSCATLHAAPLGRPLYESFGFAATNEMRLPLGADKP